MNFSTEKMTELIIAFAPKVLLAILMLIIGFWLIGKITKIAKKTMDRQGLDTTIQPFLSSLISVLLKVLLLISIAGVFGVPIASFVAILGAAAFAIGMALQGSLGHFASGILILIFKPYKVGDTVKIGGDKTGIVDEIQIFNTKLLTFDNKIIFVPNGLITSNAIENIFGASKRRVDITIGIGYDDSIDKARQIIKDTASQCPEILQNDANQVMVASHGDSSINLTVRFWCNSENYWTVYFYLLENIKKNFDKNDIGIPFPQMDVHMINNISKS